MAEDRRERLTYPFPLPSDLDESAEKGGAEAGVSPYALANQLLRHARWVIGLPLIAFLVTALYIANQDQSWVADSKFLPAKAEFGSGGGNGVLSQLNRLVGGGATSPDGMFYSFLTTSTAFLRSAARSEYEFTRPTEEGGTETVRGTLAEIHDYQTEDPETDMRVSLSLLRGMVSSSVEPGTGFVNIKVSAPWRGLAVAVNDRLLELVNEFNVEQRQTQASSEREFVEARMQAAEQERDQAQNELIRFLEQNQAYENSPRLRYEAMRLESQVELKRGLYNSLVQSYEQARIAEVRNTPVVTVVERPEETVYRPKSGSAPMRYGLMAAVLAALITIGFIGVRAYFSRQREEHPDDFEEFRRLARKSLPGRLRARLAAAGSRANGSGGSGGGAGGGGGSPVATGASASGEAPETW